MNFSRATRPFFVFLLLSISGVEAKDSYFSFKDGDIEGSISGKFNTSTNFTMGSLLNKEAYEIDKVIGTKTTVNLQGKFKTPLTTVYADVKSTALWGNNRQIGTSKVTIKDVDAVSLSHSHVVAERVIWLKEAWLELNLTNMFSLNLPKQTFTIGSLPFSIGRGISLGSAYSISPTTLGFYSDSSVDQYAFGAKIAGDIKEDFLTYDIYGAVLENKSTSTSEVAAQTQAQAFGGKENPARGFGMINWLFAARTKVTPLKGEDKKLIVEPYVVYNDAPEQAVEFSADSSSKLTTLGMAVDLEWDRMEVGLEGAFNFGKQKVKGWDRNKIEKINRAGVMTFVYSDVYSVDPNLLAGVTAADKVIYDPSGANKTAINDVARSESSNGTQVGTAGIWNSSSRFRAPYENKYNGFMAVADISFWMYKKDFKISAAGGIASGDRNPNTNLADPNEPNIDGDYAGFLGLQELYRGTKVKSAYVMGGKLTRPLSAPNSGNQFAATTSGFSNIIYGGFSGKYEPKGRKRKLSFHPNVLGYWQHAATTKFDITAGLSSTELADKFLGTEFNLLSTIGLSEDIEATFSGAVFFPGQHYKDIKGKPFNAAQRKALDAANKTAISSVLPVLGTDPGYSFVVGLTYSF
ncbi:MAG: hypothetical protein ACJAZS_000417 [Alteromonas naphthalenivorans]|jgi:hypothetical protein